jgi:3-hydroxybutyryl-CoA dehydratase
VLDQERINAYADASHDHNPIHVDATFAATTPFGGTIAHGMLVLALIGEMMHATHEQRWIETGKLKVRFKSPTRPGAAVTASATFVRQSAGLLEYTVQCADGTGETLIEGRASVAAP